MSSLKRTLTLPVDRLRRRLLIHRRGLAALCAAGAVVATVSILRPPEPAAVPLWTAARDLASGTVLSPADLRRTAFDPGSVPAAPAVRREDLLGRTLALPLGEGEVLTATKVVSDDLLTGFPGLAALPVRIPDGDVVGLLEVGDRIDLVASDLHGDQPPQQLLTAAPVLAVPGPAATDSSGTLVGRLVLLGVPAAQAPRIAAASTSLFLTVIWKG